jgi:hypothetical protein
MSIIDLQETSPNNWKAKYRGNYGTYTVKIETDGKETKRFSCSCPSDYYPCKHIPIVQEAISERITKSENGNATGLFEKTIKEIPLNDLQDFIIRWGLHNSSFQQAVLLEFTSEQKHSAGSNSYSEIIRNGLEDAYIDEDAIYDYHYESMEIDVLDQWLQKARDYMNQGNCQEAILIAKACHEEYAEWAYETIDSDMMDYICENYIYDPFEILREAKKQRYLSADDLLDYCNTESKKKKYAHISMRSAFEEMIRNLTEETDPEKYLKIQTDLFNELSDKTSHEAKRILERIIAYYKKRGEEETAWKIVEENIQIESFREEVVKKRITDKEFKKAKKLINDFLQTKNADDSGYYGRHYSHWDQFLLEIAQKENNVGDIRKYTKRFIEDRFDSNHYNRYKSTFSTEEWPTQMEKLIKHYQKGNNWFNANIADVFVSEKQNERLLKYIEQHAHINVLEKYYPYFMLEFPDRTLMLFKKMIDDHMKNTGREIYEKTVQLFEYMLKIKGGKEMVKQMISNYKGLYRNRKAMNEILDNFSNKKMR